MKPQKGSSSGHLGDVPHAQLSAAWSRERHEISELCSGRGAVGDSQTKPCCFITSLARWGPGPAALHACHLGTSQWGASCWDQMGQKLAEPWKQRATHAARASTSPRHHQLPGHPGEEFKVFLLIWSSKCFKSTKYTIASPRTGATLIKTIDALNESFLAKTLEFWYLLPSSARQSLRLTLQDNGESCFPL